MVGQHEATDSVCRLDMRRLPRQCNLDGNTWYLEPPPMFIPSLHMFLI